MNCGVPQGSIALTLYILCKRYNECTLTAIVFTDDTHVPLGGKIITTLIQIMKDEPSKISEW